MNSRANPDAVAEIQNLSTNARGELSHVLGNGHFIISGTAHQLLEHDDEKVRSSARTIIQTINELTEQQREMLADRNAHLGGNRE